MKREKDNAMISTAIRLPKKLRDRLIKAGGEYGLSDEIRQRLEASFATQEGTSPKMRALLDTISSTVREVTQCIGDPAVDPYAADVLKACVGLLIDHSRPSGEAVPHLTTTGQWMYGPDLSLQEISRDMARFQIRECARKPR
jgi:hypothetical protein